MLKRPLCTRCCLAVETQSCTQAKARRFVLAHVGSSANEPYSVSSLLTQMKSSTSPDGINLSSVSSKTNKNESKVSFDDTHRTCRGNQDVAGKRSVHQSRSVLQTSWPVRGWPPDPPSAMLSPDARRPLDAAHPMTSTLTWGGGGPASTGQHLVERGRIDELI